MPLSPLAKRTIRVSVIAFLLSAGAGIGLRILGQSDRFTLPPLAGRSVDAQTARQPTAANPAPAPGLAPTPAPISTPVPSPDPSQLDDRLKASIRLANQSRYAEALEQLNKIAPTDPVAVQAQTLREAWATQMLDRALEKYNEADLKGAIAIAVAIPQETTAGQEIQQQIPTWRRQKLILDDALALVQSNPQEALTRLKTLEDAPFASSSRYKKWIEQSEAQIRWQSQRYAY